MNGISALQIDIFGKSKGIILFQDRQASGNSCAVDQLTGQRDHGIHGVGIEVGTTGPPIRQWISVTLTC